MQSHVYESRFEVVLQYRDIYLSPLYYICLQIFSSRCLMRARLNFSETYLNSRSQNITPMELIILQESIMVLNSIPSLQKYICTIIEHIEINNV